MLFDFGFELSPSVDAIKINGAKKRLANCQNRIKKLSQSKIFTREMLSFLREELDYAESLRQQIEESN